eukprot:EG_transcript_13919
MVEVTGVWRIPGISATWKVFSWPFYQMLTLAKYLGLDTVMGLGASGRPFWEYFHEKYVAQDPQAPGLPFFEGSFTEAADEAKRQFRFLLVYLHSEQHHNTAQFCRVTLQRPAVLHVLLDNFVLWGASVLDSEGYYYSHTLQACGFPFLGVIATIDGQKQLVMRMEGALTEEVLVSKLQDCVENVGPSLIAARVEAEARVANERLREEQDRAYEEAQRQDRERLLQRRRQEEEEERARQAAEEARRQAELEAQREELSRQQRQARIEALRAAKLASLAPEPTNGPDVSTLRITMFDGSNVIRRFRLEDKLQEVHNFIMAQQGWNGQEFILTTNPVRLLDLNLTIQAEGLFPRAVVIAKEAEVLQE